MPCTHEFLYSCCLIIRVPTRVEILDSWSVRLLVTMNVFRLRLASMTYKCRDITEKFLQYNGEVYIEL